MQAILEHNRRTAVWTAGEAVTLADGSTWHLPRLDAPLLISMADLAADLRHAITLANRLATLDPDSPAEDGLADANFDHYHALAGRLLRLNYELEPGEWDEVLPADRGRWFADLVCRVGDAIVLAVADDWRGLAFSFLAVEHDALLSN